MVADYRFFTLRNAASPIPQLRTSTERALVLWRPAICGVDEKASSDLETGQGEEDTDLLCLKAGHIKYPIPSLSISI